MKKLILIVLAVVLASCGSAIDADLEMDGMARSAAPAIELVSAKSRHVNLGHSVLIGVIEGTIEVANYSSTKSVGIVYSVDGGEWQTSNAAYMNTLPNGREIWRFPVTIFEIAYTANPDARNIEFALFMEANGQTY